MTASTSSRADSADARTGLRAVFADVAGIAGSQYVLRFSTMIKGFVVARVLGPAGNGLWQHYSLIFEYGQSAQLGVMEGYNKRIGHLIGRRDDENLEAARATGLTGIVIAAVVLWAALAASVALNWDRSDPSDRFALPMLGLIILLEQVTNLYKALLRADGRVSLITTNQLRFAFFNLFLSLALLPKFGMLGLMVAWLVSRTTNTSWLVRKSGEKPRFALLGPEIKALLAAGFPIWLYNLTKVALRNVDRVLVDSVLQKSDLGIYGLAVTLASLVRYSADAVGFVIYPIFLRLYGQTRDPATLRDHLEKPTAFMTLLVSIALGFSYLVLPLPVRWLLPEFLASIEVFRLLTVSIVFSCLAVLPGFYLMAIDRQNWLVPLGLAAVAFNYFVGLVAIHHGGGLPGVAMVTAAGQFLHTTSVMVIAGRHMRGSALRGVRWAAETYLPVAYTAALVGALVAAAGRTPVGAWGETPRAALQGALFLVISVPLLVRFERRTQFLRKLRRGPRGAEPPVPPV
jgi:O-antigen/teichoic acid export membrane protein